MSSLEEFVQGWRQRNLSLRGRGGSADHKTIHCSSILKSHWQTESQCKELRNVTMRSAPSEKLAGWEWPKVRQQINQQTKLWHFQSYTPQLIFPFMQPINASVILHRIVLTASPSHPTSHLNSWPDIHLPAGMIHDESSVIAPTECCGCGKQHGAETPKQAWNINWICMDDRMIYGPNHKLSGETILLKNIYFISQPARPLKNFGYKVTRSCSVQTRALKVAQQS